MDECVVLLAEASFWMKPSSYIAILKVLFGLGAVIFVHELGHFLLAKACGVKCDKFYVGFDVPIKLFGQTIIPAKLLHFQWGETEYGIGAIPLGGYVKMMGQDDDPSNLEKQVEESIADGEKAEEAYLPSGLVDQSKLDPRSYLSKSVIQRMLIISAGVIFNLIFAVVFAAFAFKSGVDYDPPMIGNVVGSGPAWKHDLAGAEVKRIGDTKAEGYFPYMNMAEAIIFGASEGPVELEVLPYGEMTPKVLEINGERGINRAVADLPLIGVGARMTPVVGERGAIEGEPAADADPPFEVGDKIVEINNTKIETDIDLRMVLARDADLPATFVLERKSGDKVTTIVAPKPINELGFSVEWLPVSVIKIGSPAEAAGMQEGDEIISINGENRGDFLVLDKRMMGIAKEGGTVDIVVKRGGEEKTLTLVPVVPRALSDVGPDRAFAIDTLGFAIPMNRKVDWVTSGSSADMAGLKAGDELVSLQYILTDEQKENPVYKSLAKKPKVHFEDDETNWAEVAEVIQLLPVGMDIEFKFKRGDLEQTAKMKLAQSSQYFYNKRGIGLVPLQHHYVSKTWGDAFKYGYYQVGKDLKRVFTTLGKLIKGKISPTNLGGPGTIALVATSEASESTSRLLLFLTFLSANLAIINFLPIPVLDGGHMMFLAYEGLFRRPVSERIQMVLTYTGLIMILSLMVFVLSQDAMRIWGLF